MGQSGYSKDEAGIADGILLQAEALIAAERGRWRLAPSTIGSTPGFRRGRPMVPLTPLRGGGCWVELPKVAHARGFECMLPDQIVAGADLRAIA